MKKQLKIIPLEVPRPSKNCSVSGRELQPGDVFFSTLVQQSDGLARRDYAPEHWTATGATLPADWIGWWKTQVPEIGEKKAKKAPNDVLLNLFEQLRSCPDREDMLYVLTLLLIRRRLLRYEREEASEQGKKILVVYAIKENMNFEIPVAMPDRERLEEVQEQLSQLLYV